MKIRLNQEGISALEVLIAMGIFALVVTTVIGVFVSGIKSQKNIKALYSLQREGNFLMERMVKDIRMAGDNISLAHPGGDYWAISFNDYNNNLVTYCRAKNSGNCASSGSQKYFSRNNQVINSEDVEIEYLRFYFPDAVVILGPPEIQPVVTISMKITSKNNPNISLFLQDSVALRVY